MRTTKALLATMLVLLAVDTAAAADIRLREEVVVAEATVYLRDVAELEGEAAQQFADVVVATFANEQRELAVTMPQVRALLEARSEMNWAMVRLRGYGKCTVYRTAMEKVDDAVAAASVKKEVPVAASPVLANPRVPVSVEAPLTLRERAIAYLREFAGGEPADLVITFEGGGLELLDQPAIHGRWEFEPATAAKLGRIPLTLRRYDEADAVVESHRVVAHVARRMLVAVTVRSMTRGQLFTHNDVEIREVHVSDHRVTPVTELSQVIGQTCAGLKHANSIIDVRDIAPAVLVKRGDKVTVRSMAGPLVVRMVGQAMESGARDEVIRVRNDSSRQEFLARVTGPQQVVVVQDDRLSEQSGGRP